MMHASKKAAALIDEATAAMGLFSPPDRAFFRDVMNECLTRLYTDVVCESARVSLAPTEGRVPLSQILSPSGAAVREEDVLSVSLDGIDARYLAPDRTAAATGASAPFYTVTGGAIMPLSPARDVCVCFLVRPPLCEEEGEADYEIPLSLEFLPLLFARLCGEGYRRAGEDALAAKWLADYNHRLTDFAAYMAAAKARRGA
jgi:hypothetical protein